MKIEIEFTDLLYRFKDLDDYNKNSVMWFGGKGYQAKNLIIVDSDKRICVDKEDLQTAKWPINIYKK